MRPLEASAFFIKPQWPYCALMGLQCLMQGRRCAGSCEQHAAAGLYKHVVGLAKVELLSSPIRVCLGVYTAVILAAICGCPLWS